MISAILSIGASVLGFISGLIGWRRDAQMKEQGREEQSLSDSEATIKEASDGQKIDGAVAGLSGSQLDDELRASAAPKG